jgi:hypothetical protein
VARIWLPVRGQGLIQAGPFPVGAGEAMIEADPLLGDAELAEPFALAVRSCLSVLQRA